MKHIAVIGESLFDTKPLCQIWNKRYLKKARFSTVLKRLEGSVLYSKKIGRMIKADMQSSDYDFIIVVRDLDAGRSNHKQWSTVQDWYSELSEHFPNNILLLNVQELEALILADIETFNAIYKTSIKFPGNPEALNSPKDFLISATHGKRKRFEVKDNQQLIPRLDFTKVEAKCKFYRDFIVELEQLLSVKPSFK